MNRIVASLWVPLDRVPPLGPSWFSGVFSASPLLVQEASWWQAEALFSGEETEVQGAQEPAYRRRGDWTGAVFRWGMQACHRGPSRALLYLSRDLVR